MTKTKKNTSDNLRKFSFLSKYNDPKAFKSFDTDFELLNYIGEGAHSVVYKCMEKHTQKLYAVKITKNIDEERL